MQKTNPAVSPVKEKNAPVDKPFFLVSAVIIIAMIILMVVFDKQTGELMNIAYNFTANSMGWAYLAITLVFFFVMIWIAVSKIGRLRLGGPKARPEFATLTWIAMFFCSGIGTALMTWATKEWAYYMQTPPFDMTPDSVLATEYAMAYPIFHWGPLGWVIYTILAFPIGYMYWNRHQDTYHFADACSGVIGERNAKGLLGKFINFTLILGLIGANGTSLGSGTPMLSESVCSLLGIPHTFGVDVVVVCIWTAIFTTSVTLGLKKGIKILSNINVAAVLALLAFILIVGPTSFIINNYVNAHGIMLTEFLRMSVYTDPIAKTGFPQAWTVFYWAWYYAYAPFMGAFIARVSRGRTLREIVVTTLGAGTLGAGLFHGIMGGNAMNQQLTGQLDFIGILNEQGDAAAIVASIRELPLAVVILVIFCFCGFIFSATTIDSAAYSMAQTSCKEIKEGEEPPRYVRLTWALAMGAIALVVMNIGGMTPIKTSSLLVALPIMIFSVFAVISFFKWIKEDEHKILEDIKEDEAIMDAERAARRAAKG